MARDLDALAHEQRKAERNLRLAQESRDAVANWGRLLHEVTRTGPTSARVVVDANVHVYRVSIAYPVGLSQSDVAEGVQQSLRWHAPDKAPIDAGLTFGYGAGAWGVEPCVYIETATPLSREALTTWLVYLLSRYSQGCACVNVDGCQAWECNVRGQWSRITG